VLYGCQLPPDKYDATAATVAAALIFLGVYRTDQIFFMAFWDSVLFG
jgi:hypothetical protein